MTWKIEYWDGTTWVEKRDAVVKEISLELNGHEEASFTVPNTADNRAFVNTDRRVRFLFASRILFQGLLQASIYEENMLTCIVYNECYEKMKTKDFTGSYSETAADTILSAIANAAGVVAGSCPSTAVSVRFRRALCYDAAVFLAKTLNKDFWGDYDASGNPRFNIGDKVNAAPYPTITPVSWPSRGVDRAKKRDKVIIRGFDVDGNEIEGSAGTGTDVAVFTERKASDVSTLNTLAAQKLSEVNKESSGVKLPVLITDSYSLEPGYYITLNNPVLNLVGYYRVFKTTKRVDVSDVEVDRAEAILEKYLQETKSYEDIGIYAPPPNLDNPPGPPAAPAGFTAIGLPLQILLKWNANTEADLDRYIIYRGVSETPTEEFAQSDTNRFVDGDVTPGTTYHYRVKARDRVGNLSNYSSDVSAAATNVPMDNVDDSIPSAPNLITDNVVVAGVNTAAEFRTWLEVTIPRVSGAAGYIVSYNVTGTTRYYHAYVEQPSSGNPIYVTPELLADTFYDVKACSVSPKGQVSAWSSTVTKKTLVNDVAPSTPTGLTATATVDGVILQWNAVTATDFSHYTVYYGTVTPPTTIAGTSARPIFFWKKKPTEAYTTYYFAVSSVDNAGNESSRSIAVSATPLQVGTPNIAPDAVTAEKILDGAVNDIKLASGAVTLAKFASGLRPVQIVDSLPSLPNSNYPEGATVFLTTDDKLYRSTGTTWTAAVPTTDLTGQITGTQIADNAISTPKLQANAVVAEKVATNAITTEKIAADAVTAAKIAAGAVSTDELAANSVTAGKIQAGAVSASKLSVAQIFIENLTFTDNSPSTGYITWSSCTVYWLGTGYSVSGGNTNLKYVYWDATTTSFTASNTKPAWSDTRFMIAINDGGIHRTVWNATYIHGGTLITGTVTAQELVANQAVITNSAQIANCIVDSNVVQLSASKILIDGTVYLSNWRASGDLTKIDGGRIYANSISVNALAADATGRMFDEASIKTAIQNWRHPSDLTLIDGGDIYTDSVHTAKIHFDSYTTRPTLREGMLYWYTGSGSAPGGQLEFSSGTALDQLAIIPKYPLYSGTVPQDSMVVNGSLESDVDGDGAPDFWQLDNRGTAATFNHLGYDSSEGSKCIQINCPRTTSFVGGYVKSDYINVEPGKRYVGRCQMKVTSAPANNYLAMHAFFFKADKTASSTVFSPFWEVSGSSTTGWEEKTGFVKVPSDARYLRIYLQADNNTDNSTLTVRFDAVWLFKQISWDSIFDEENTVSTYSKRWQGESDAITKATGTEVVDDSTASGGKAVRRLYTQASGQMWSGPHVKVGAGEFYALFSLKMANWVEEAPVLDIDVFSSAGGGVLTHKYLTPSMIGTDWKVFALRFRAREDWSDVELRGYFYSGRATVYMDWVGVVSANVPLASIGVTVLEFDPGTTSVATQGDIVNDAIFAVGAQASVNPGAYTTVASIPSSSLTEDCDYAFVSFSWYASADQTVAWRVLDTTINRPSNRVVYQAYVANTKYFCMCFLPWNVKGHNLAIQVYLYTTTATVTVNGYSWAGAAPHTHSITGDTHAHSYSDPTHQH